MHTHTHKDNTCARIYTCTASSPPNTLSMHIFSALRKQLKTHPPFCSVRSWPATRHGASCYGNGEERKVTCTLSDHTCTHITHTHTHTHTHTPQGMQLTTGHILYVHPSSNGNPKSCENEIVVCDNLHFSNVYQIIVLINKEPFCPCWCVCG